MNALILLPAEISPAGCVIAVVIIIVCIFALLCIPKDGPQDNDEP